MVARGGSPVRSQNSGELSPEAEGRADLKAFAAAGRRFKNVEPVPLSGFRQMPGSRDYGPVRGRTTTLSITSPTPSPGPHTGTQTIWTGTVSGVVAGLDAAAIDASAGAPTIWAEALVSGVWTQLGATQAGFSATAQARTFAAAPGAGLTATSVRLRANCPVSATVNVGTVTALSETATIDAPRYWHVAHDDGSRYAFSLQEKFLDIFEGTTHVAGVFLATATAAMLPSIRFYAENATLGIFHNDLETLRVRRAGDDNSWERDLWPYDGMPTDDLGGVYTKTTDKWDIRVKWGVGNFVYRVRYTVDGENTPDIAFKNAGGDDTDIGSTNAGQSAAAIKAALEDLPSLGATINVSIVVGGSELTISIEFAGDLSGREYEVSAACTNDAGLTIFSTHRQVGETDFEAIASASRGWPGATGLLQDRLLYVDFKAVKPAIAYSRTAEYFDVNVKSAASDAAIYDKLRSGDAIERVLAISDSVYGLFFTDRGVRFLTNRTISRSEPRNYPQAASEGIARDCLPVDLEGRVYYVARDPDDAAGTLGTRLVSLEYSEIVNSFEAIPESLLASHLAQRLIRAAGQLPTGEAQAARVWLLRDDGRLIAGFVIRSQEVLGFAEWIAAAGGAVREIDVDAENTLRVAVQRGSQWRHEILDRDIFLQAAIAGAIDMAGEVTGLALHEGRQVWAVAEGYVLGPFTVAAGAIDLEEFYDGEILVGPWQPPVWESLPRWLELPNGDVVERPGRIHTVRASVIDTTSIAIGANGGAAENVPLLSSADPVDAPPPAKTGKFAREGILGRVVGTTAVVTQTRPGALHVRDLTIEEKL